MKGLSQLMEKYQTVYENLTVQQKLDLALDEGIMDGDYFSWRMTDILTEIYKEGKVKNGRML